MRAGMVPRSSTQVLQGRPAPRVLEPHVRPVSTSFSWTRRPHTVWRHTARRAASPPPHHNNSGATLLRNAASRRALQHRHALMGTSTLRDARICRSDNDSFARLSTARPISVRSPTPCFWRRQARTRSRSTNVLCGMSRSASVLSWRCSRSRALASAGL